MKHRSLLDFNLLEHLWRRFGRGGADSAMIGMRSGRRQNLWLFVAFNGDVGYCDINLV